MSIFKGFFHRKKIEEILGQSGEVTEESSISPVAHSELTESPITIGRQKWDVGDVVLDRYELIKVIESGGMGIVFIAYDFQEMRHVVFKSFKDKFLPNDGTVNRFLKEAEIWVKLEPHPNVVQAEMFRLLEGRPFILMEYVPGSDLRAWIHQPELTIIRCLDFAIQFCRGMNHAGLVHRDIKPENIMIDRQGVLKITDFGLAKVGNESYLEAVALLNQDPQARVDELAMVRLKGGFGTPPYMPPEQFEAAERVDLAADVYSFGVTLYEMLTGRWPFRGGRTWQDWQRQHQTETPPNPRQLNPKIPLVLSNLVLKCLAKEPAKRYPNFEVLQTELEQIYQQVEKQPYELLEVSSEKALCDRGLAQFQAGELLPALASCDKALALNPKSARAWLHKADILVKLNRYDEALQGYDRALQVTRRLPQLWNNRGLLLRILGNDPEAIHCYDEALQLDANYYPAWNNRGLSLFTLGRLNAALADLDRALAIQPHFADAWFNRGGVLRALDRPKEALASFDSVIRVTPHNPRPWLEKAVTFAAELGDIEEAIACIDQALVINPGDSEAVEARAMLLEQLRQKYGPQVAAKWEQGGRADVKKTGQWRQMSQHLHQQEGTVLNLETPAQPEREALSSSEKRMASMFGLGNYEETIRYAEQALTKNPNDIVALVHKGISLAKLGQAQAGLEYLERAVASAPSFELAWYAKGVALESLQRYEDAITCYDEVLRRHPAYSDAWNNKGNALKELYRYEEALACYDQALKINGRRADAWGNKGGVLIELERCQEGLVCCEQAVKLDPRSETGWHNKGIALKKLGCYEEALEALARAVEIKPRFADALLSQGEVLIYLGRLAEAKQVLERGERLQTNALVSESVDAKMDALKPGSSSDRLGVALELHRLGRYEESLAHYNEILALNPQFTQVLTFKATTLQVMGQLDEALTCYDQLLTIDPANTTVLMARGQLLKDLGRFSEALESYDETLRLDPGEQAAMAWDAKGQILEAMGRMEEALRAFEHALELDHKFDWAWINKGLLYHHQGHHQKAIECYDQALKITESNDAAWNNKGNALSALGADPEEILLCYVKAIRLNPDNELALNNAGVIFQNMQRYEDALGYFERALALDANYQDAWLNRGNVLKALERFDEALLCFDKVLQLNPEVYLAWEAKGSILGDQGQLDEGMACMNRCLELNPNTYVPWFNKGAFLFNAKRYEEALTCFDQALILAPNNKEVRDMHRICQQTVRGNSLMSLWVRDSNPNDMAVMFLLFKIRQENPEMMPDIIKDILDKKIPYKGIKFIYEPNFIKGGTDVTCIFERE